MSQPIDGHNSVTIAQIALVALGSNAASPSGNAEKAVVSAIKMIGTEIGVIRAASHLYSTPCFPAGAGPDYVNAALVIETRSSPDELLAQFHQIESDFGRERIERWGDRILDIDLLGWGDAVLPDLATYEDWRAMPADLQRMRAPDELVLPHPRMQDRAFVLVPLAEVAPDWQHPVLGMSVRAMLAALPEADLHGIRPL